MITTNYITTIKKKTNQKKKKNPSFCFILSTNKAETTSSFLLYIQILLFSILKKKGTLPKTTKNSSLLFSTGEWQPPNEVWSRLLWSDVQRLEHTFYSSDCVFPVNFWTSDKSGHSTTKFNFARERKKKKNLQQHFNRSFNNWLYIKFQVFSFTSFFFPKLEYLMAIDIILCIKFSSPNFLAYDLIYFYTYIHINPRKYYCGYF